MITKKFYVVRIVENAKPLYTLGYNRWTKEPSNAKLYTDLKSVQRLIEDTVESYKPEILHATLILEDATDLLEKALDLS